MACRGSELSTSMSTEDQNIDKKHVYEIALRHFRKHKVDISDAIKTKFPFLELLRDNGFITNETYEESQECFKKRITVQEVVYDVLSKLEDTFDLSLLRALFSKVIMKNYPDLNRIYKSFKNAIPDIKLFLERDEEESGESPRRLEQGPGENSYQNLSWPCPDFSNYNDTSTPGKGLSEDLYKTEQVDARRNNMTCDNKDALERQQANEQCAQEVKPPAINSEDSAESSDGDEFPQAATWDPRSPGVPGCEEASTASPQASTTMGAGNLANNAAIRKAKRKRRPKFHTDGSMDFHSEVLSVTCGELKGLLIKRKLARGATVKSIRKEDGNWCTPREFEIAGGYQNSSDWKSSVYCGGRSLKRLMKENFLPTPPRSSNRKRKAGKPDVCEICQDEGKIFCCHICQKYFHEDCHIPPVETERNLWSCTFCWMDEFSATRKCHRESEVLARQMEPEERLKCEFLLLKVYCQLESSVLKGIPPDDDIEVASQCLKELRKLDIIKKKLMNYTEYSRVGEFVEDVHHVFEEYRPLAKRNDSDLTEEEFKKEFKEIFGILETN